MWVDKSKVQHNRWSLKGLCFNVWLTAAMLVLPTIGHTADGEKIVTTSDGALRCATFSDGRVECLGVPYAAPPVGELRLRPPAPVTPWEGDRDARSFASTCLQPKTEYSKSQEGSEDCLYLNVYVPASAHQSEALPVMVWLHGGGFVNGSGNAFNGAFLANTANAIVVTVNYRLGALGWLALPSLSKESPDGISGNYGLQDSIQSLKWVRSNIAALGGNSARVTVMGQSAGGEQVLALLASPAGAGLFQRAISMSAPASISLPTIEQAAATRTKFLDEVGCSQESSQANCLRSLPAQKILDASHTSWDLIQQLGLQFTPVVDGKFLSKQWVDIFEAGNYNRVPAMIGHTKEEARLFVAINENNRGAAMDEKQMRDRSGKFFKAVAPLVYWKYPISNYEDAAAMMARALTDAQFAAGLTHVRNALSTNSPVYAYQSCDPDAPESHVHAKFMKLGCAHDSDLPYLFQWDDFTGEVPAFNADQKKLAEDMGRYWGNFAAKGDPNGPGLPEWPAYNVDKMPVQLLEPASTGGIRTTAEGEYHDAHNLGFWSKILWIASKLGIH